MKAFVTGGAGFIGSQVVRSLLKRNISVRVLVLPGENTINLKGFDVELVEGNILDPSVLAKVVKGCDWVFHLAAIYALWLPKMELMRKVNVEGTRNVLTAAGEAGASRVVYTSTIAACGGVGLDADATEETPFLLGKTGSLYAQTKYESQLVALEFARNGLNVRIVMPTGPIGPGDVGPTPTGRLLLAVVKYPVVPIFESSNNMADVRDVGEGHVLAAEKGKKGEKYLLGNENYSAREFAMKTLSVMGISKPVISLPISMIKNSSYLMLFMSKYVTRKPPLLTPDSVRIGQLGLRANCAKAFRVLGLPRRPIEESIRDALIWFANNGYIKNPGLWAKGL